MYLTKIELQYQSVAIRAALSDCQKMHRLINGLFCVQRKEAEVLYRILGYDMKCVAYIFSSLPVDESNLINGMILVGQRDVTEWVDSFKAGKQLTFDLLTMPSKKVKIEGQKNSQRRILRSSEERLQWLSKKALENGFVVLSAQETNGSKLQGKHDRNQGGNFYLDTYRYQGVLMIQDEDLFQKAVCQGIGPEKAYGLGMLILG